MVKFRINAVLNSSDVHDSKKTNACSLIFDADDAMKPSYHGSVIVLKCEKFVFDEVNSSKNWRDAFGFNEEPPKGALITVNLGYKAGEIMPYSEWKDWCWCLLAPFLIKNRK